MHPQCAGDNYTERGDGAQIGAAHWPPCPGALAWQSARHHMRPCAHPACPTAPPPCTPPHTCGSETGEQPVLDGISSDRCRITFGIPTRTLSITSDHKIRTFGFTPDRPLPPLHLSRLLARIYMPQLPDQPYVTLACLTLDAGASARHADTRGVAVRGRGWRAAAALRCGWS